MTYISLKRFFVLIGLPILAFISTNGLAAIFTVPADGSSVVGNVQYTKASFTDSTSMVANRYNLGLNSIIAANPGTTETTLATHYVKLPTEFVLPPLPRRGIIINLPEMRLYYYPEGTDNVMIFPIGIGKIGNTIPIRNTTITRKIMNPSWMPGPDVRKYNEEQGITLPHIMPPGPDNPLGPYAIYLNIPSFLIHSTIFPESIGRRASFGCIRMNETDIKDFYPLVLAGTPVAIVNMPNKVGWNGNRLYLEAHPPLDEQNIGTDFNRESMVISVQNALPKNAVTIVDWQLVAHLAEEPDGVPHDVGVRVNGGLR